jgi:hypothetical protein
MFVAAGRSPSRRHALAFSVCCATLTQRPRCNQLLLLLLLLLCCCLVYICRLDLSNVHTADSLAQLPVAQLQQLRLSVNCQDIPDLHGSIFDQALPLGHLTSVTLLECTE